MPERSSAKVGRRLINCRFSASSPAGKILKGNIIGSPGLAPEEKERLSAMLSALADEFALCHGDFHGGNIQRFTEGKTDRMQK